MTNIQTDSQLTSPPPNRPLRVRAVMRAHTLTSFFLLTVVLSWWPWPLYATGHSPEPIASFGPLLAALLVLGMTEGRSGIQALVGSMVHWRVPVRWWLAFVAFPP